MSLQASIHAALADIEAADITAKPIPYLIATFVFVALVYSLGQKPESKAPFLNPRRPFELTAGRAKGHYMRNCRSLLRSWFDSHPNEPAQLITDFGNMTVLPPSMANEIRNNPKLSFTDFSVDVSLSFIRFWAFNSGHDSKTDLDPKFFQTAYPGFEASFQGTKDAIILPVINKDLTKYLGQL